MWQGLRLLKERDQAALFFSNALTGLGTGMQVLVHGWLLIAWGHDAWLLAAFAVTRFLPKALLTVPAGVLCDRCPRAVVLVYARHTKAAASLLPLMAFFAPLPLFWILGASVVAGSAQVFETPAGRGILGDITPKSDLTASVALNAGAGHAAALVSPALAFVLVQAAGRPTALIASAVVLALSGLVAASLPVLHGLRSRGPRSGVGGFLGYLRSTPAVLILLVALLLPAVVDKGVVLLLPSMSDSARAMVGLALVAPEIGALAAAGVMSLAPVRLNGRFLLFALLLYVCLMVNALRWSDTPMMLVGALMLAGMARLAFTVSVLSWVQHEVPADLRGRVLAI